MPDLRAALAVIEADLDADRYRPGPWDAFVRSVRRRPREDRVALAEDISRVSAKLHRRGGVRTLPIAAALGMELLATGVATGLLVWGLRVASTVAVLVGTGILVMTFQPLIKVTAGAALGVGYDYAYLRGVEPRFKMRFGTYLAAPRCSRVLLHLSGTIGSPLAAWIVAQLARAPLPLASAICSGVFWITAVINVVPFVAALAGIRRLGRLKLSTASAGVAGVELREALVGGSA